MIIDRLITAKCVGKKVCNIFLIVGDLCYKNNSSIAFTKGATQKEHWCQTVIRTHNILLCPNPLICNVSNFFVFCFLLINSVLTSESINELQVIHAMSRWTILQPLEVKGSR